MKEMIPLSLRQRKAFVWWARREYEDYAAIICDGAIRSGKTLAMGMGFFFWAMACFSDRQFALCGRSVGALRRRGFRVMRANNAVADGLRVTADLLKKRRLVICRSCKDCLREMESYEWVNDGSGHDVPRKENDHAMDEMRYFAMSVAAGRGAMPTACAVTRTTNWRGAAER